MVTRTTPLVVTALLVVALPAAGATKQDVTKAMEGHVKGQAELMGRYGR